MSEPYITRASNALYDALCPGRFQAQADIPEPEPDEDALAGTRIHALYAGKTVDEPTNEELQSAQDAREIEASAVDAWKQSLPAMGIDFEYTEHREEVMLLLDDKHKPLHRGQFDMMLAAHPNDPPGAPAHLFINDLKALWGVHDRSDKNLQLRDYAAMASILYPREVASITVNLMQPNKSEKPDLVTYEQGDLMRAQMEMYERIAASRAKGAKRIPGIRQCKYCRAKMSCPEYLAFVERESEKALLVCGSEVPTKLQMAGSMVMLTNDRLLEMLEYHEILKMAYESIRTEAKRRLEKDEKCLPGWYRKAVRPRRWVKDTTKVYQKLANIGVSGSEFSGHASISFAAIKEMIVAHTRIGNRLIGGKALDDVLEEVIKDAVNIDDPRFELRRTEP